MADCWPAMLADTVSRPLRACTSLMNTLLPASRDANGRDIFFTLVFIKSGNDSRSSVFTPRSSGQRSDSPNGAAPSRLTPVLVGLSNKPSFFLTRRPRRLCTRQEEHDEHPGKCNAPTEQERQHRLVRHDRPQSCGTLPNQIQQSLLFPMSARIVGHTMT
jgi:hypothetical protein